MERHHKICIMESLPSLAYLKISKAYLFRHLEVHLRFPVIKMAMFQVVSTQACTWTQVFNNMV